MTPDDARRFFVDKVVGEAHREGVRLSDNEQKMLNWSEVEPGCIADPQVAEGLATEMSDQEYEAKIGRLLAAAYGSDVASDPDAKAVYREAYSVLKQGDYYLVVMLEQALGRQLRRWWQFTVS
jgi:hypothetical protein